MPWMAFGERKAGRRGRGAEGDGSFRFPLFALRSPTRRPRCKRAVFDENQTITIRRLGVKVAELSEDQGQSDITNYF